jgi:hypothetical protein
MCMCFGKSVQVFGDRKVRADNEIRTAASVSFKQRDISKNVNMFLSRQSIDYTL